MRQKRKSPTRGLIRALLLLAAFFVATSGFFAVRAASAGSGAVSQATTTVPAPDPPPVKPKPKPKPKPPPPPPPPHRHAVVVPPPPPPPPVVTPPPPPPAVVVPPPPPPPAPVKVTHHKRHKARRAHHAHRRHVAAPRIVPRALMARPAAVASVQPAKAAVIGAPVVAADQPSSGHGGLGALVAALLVLSALLLLAATVPLHLLPIRVAEVIAPRRPDCATAGAIGLLAVAIAYVVAQS